MIKICIPTEDGWELKREKAMKEFSKEAMTRKSNIENIINRRTSISIDKSIEELTEVSTIIRELNQFIEGKLDLDNNQINIKIKRLISHFTINLIFDLDSEIALRRARKFTEESTTSYCFNNLQDLSYIPDEKKYLVPLGRFNKKEEPMFYTTVHLKNTEEQFFKTAISEIGGTKLDYINILDSVPTKRLNSIYIGIFDYFIRNKRFPELIEEHEEIFSNIFQEFKNQCIEKDLLSVYESYILCSSFFSDIIKRKKSDTLYQVTSILSSVLLESPNIDAIIYESVEVTDEPSMVIKPNIVDHHIEHKNAYCFKITNDLGYGIYYLEEVNSCEIVNNNLMWEK